MLEGLWVLLISVASFHSTVFPRPLTYLGFVVGIAGVITVVPPLSELSTVFGVGQILWFAWIGVHVLWWDDARPARSAAVS